MTNSFTSENPKTTALLAGIFLFFSACTGSSTQSSQKLELPDGFYYDIFANNVPNARQLALGEDGTVYAGSRSAGKVYAMPDKNSDFRADTVIVIAENLQMPSGIAYSNGHLYIGAVNTIYRLDDIGQNLMNPPEPTIVTNSYPTETHHGWKFIAFGPGGELYVPVGAPCNICNPEKEIFASITRINPDGTNREIVAQGVRNTVGFDWHPETGNMWFTDNGRDWLGDNRPPDELNRLTEMGQHFGYPYKHGSDIWDPEFGEQGKEMDIDFQSPVRELGPHVAALGMIFYTGEMFPEDYQNNVLIAEHGSWNRSEKIGYRITRVNTESNPPTYTPFAKGWLQNNGSVWGRPVDLLQLGDGSVLISDDYGGTIYRITYNHNRN